MGISFRLLNLAVIAFGLSWVPVQAALFTFQLPTRPLASLDFSPVIDYQLQRLSGRLDRVSIDAVIISDDPHTWAHDFTLLKVNPTVSNVDLIVGGPAMDGIFLRPEHRYYWTNGFGGTGTIVSGDVVIDPPMVLTGDSTVDGFFLIGNGFVRPGTWSGTMTFHGLTLVPIPEPLTYPWIAASFMVAAAVWSRRARRGL